MTLPGGNQTVHLMNSFDVLRVYRSLRCKEGRNASELELYTTDDLRHLYQSSNDDLIRLRDGIITRVQLVATIRYRVLGERVSYFALLFLTVVAAVASVVAAVEGWK